MKINHSTEVLSKKLLVLIITIIINFISITLAKFGFLYFLTLAFVWIPLAAIYQLLFIVIKDQCYSYTFYKIFGLLISDVLIFVFIHIFIGSEEALMIGEAYKIIGIPSQIIFILIIDKTGYRSLNKQ